MSQTISAARYFENQRLMARYLGEQFGCKPDEIRWFNGRLTSAGKRAAGEGLADVIPIEGFSNVETVDRHGTVFDPDGANQDAWRSFPTGFFNHYPWEPIIRWDASKSEIRKNADGLRGLWDEGVIFGDTQQQQVAQFYARQGLLALSIGFIPHKGEDREVNGEDVWAFTDYEILEKSGVTLPSNRESLFDIAESVERGSDITCPRCAVPSAQLVTVPNVAAALKSLDAHLETAVRKGESQPLLEVAEQLESYLNSVRSACTHLPPAPELGDEDRELTDAEVVEVVETTLEHLRETEAAE